MREGMKCKVTLAKLDDGTLNIKEIAWQKKTSKYQRQKKFLEL
jgi:hypothetical protein